MIFPVLLICGLIFLLPDRLWVLVRPSERLLFGSLALLPLTVRKARLSVFIGFSCYVMMLNSVLIEIDKAQEPIKDASMLIEDLAVGKKLCPVYADCPMRGHIGYGLHLHSNYDGYVPSLFDTPYTAVRYKEKPVYSSTFGIIDVLEIQNYDYIFVWVNEGMIDSCMQEKGWELIGSKKLCSIYENLNKGEQ